ncbi:hypothetical protein HY495_04100 [Candidatus Woesearchaeota archaeon]|nr:hypothetical protein [Candidatus Woesearchaeota archaeon]
MSTLLTLTEHNLDHFLDAYARAGQPVELIVPYDQQGGEITLPAPLRADVQCAVLEYDFRTFFGCDGITVRFLGGDAFSKRARIIDPRHPELESQKIADGLYVYSSGATFLYSTRRDNPQGLERLAQAVRQFSRSEDGRCVLEHLDVGLALLRNDYTGS